MFGSMYSGMRGVNDLSATGTVCVSPPFADPYGTEDWIQKQKIINNYKGQYVTC